ncbi:helix-turn-helix transcriptional regulator [Streptomyces sp. NPDC056161]|uniref:helix-turn-helix transcriptional regulator n=1 Tax=Streptomyces sp. NPDC056161 TaxID=3345732 RepID=UPI0035DAE38C
MAQEATATVQELTVRDLLDLPAVVDVETACRVLGISRSHGYNLARTGDFPCRVLRAGRSFRVVTADLRRILGIQEQAAAANETAATAAV